MMSPKFLRVNLEKLDLQNLPNIAKKSDRHVTKQSDLFKTPKLKRKNSCDESKSELEPHTPKTHIEFNLELKKVINERNILTSKTRKRVFDALDDMKKKSEEESRHFKREKALLEIINSEIKYVHQLEIIINFFMKPTQTQNLLRPEDFHAIFGNIQTIHSINKELLEELDKGPHNVTHAFSLIAPFLKLYSVYAYEFQNILNLLQNARALNPQFAKFVANQESRPEVQNKLSALLITPIQRVPRYKLLLMQLLELTAPEETGYESLSDCLEKVNDATDHINKIVGDYENSQRLLELQRHLKSGEPSIIKPGRKLIKEGILIKMSTKNAPSEKLYVVLMNDIIMFNKMKKSEPKVGSLKCLSIFPLTKCKVIELLDKGCLRIICQDEEFILYHDQLSETRNWAHNIKDAIDMVLNDRKTLRKDSSSRRPVKRKDLHEYNEIGLSPGKPLKKRKLENELMPIKSLRISKRPPIRHKLFDYTAHDNQASTSQSTRSIFVTKENVENNSHGSSENESTQMSKELFIFGRAQQNDDTRFGKFFGGIGSTIKKFLGFKT